MPDQTLRLRLGLFLALAIAGALALAFLFGGAPRLFTSRARYTVTFPEAPGLAVGTPVRKSGIRVGDVTRLDLDEESGLVRVGMLIEPAHAPRPTDDVTISRGLLSGDTTLDIVPRATPLDPAGPKPDPYPPGSEIKGLPPINPRTLLNQTAGAIPTAQESLVRMSQAFLRFEAAAPHAERALDEVAALARAGREAIPEFRQTNLKLQELIGTAPPPKPAAPGAGPGARLVAAQLPGDPLEPAAVAANTPTIRQALGEIIELLRSIRPAADQFRAVLEENGPGVGETLRSVKRTSDSINDLVNPENRKAASATLRNLQVASDDLTRTIRLAAIVLDRADTTFTQLNGRLEQVGRVLANAEKASVPVAANADAIVADVAAAAKNVNVAASELSRTLIDVRGAVQGAAKGDGSVQRLLTDPTLFNNLNDATLSAARLVARAEKIAADLQVFADKVARRPELIGVGGAVRPSAGLKESPTAPLPPDPLAPVPPQPGGASRPVPFEGGGVLTPIPPVSPSYRPPLPAGDRPGLLEPR